MKALANLLFCFVIVHIVSIEINRTTVVNFYVVALNRLIDASLPTLSIVFLYSATKTGDRWYANHYYYVAVQIPNIHNERWTPPTTDTNLPTHHYSDQRQFYFLITRYFFHSFHYLLCTYLKENVAYVFCGNLNKNFTGNNYLKNLWVSLCIPLW